ncbi:MAG TPA: O-antigen ligase family protein [Chloroflexia bacterium]|nr:O-antigen ligase family protein [Chloroflexia bacterium]
MEATQAPPAAVPATIATSRGREILQSDGAALVAMFLAIGVYYLLPGLATAAVGAAAFIALAIWKPHLTPIPIVAGMALFARPRAIGRYVFPLDEFLIFAAVGAWALRDGLAWLRAKDPLGRVVPVLRDAVRHPFAWAAAGFLVAGVLSLVLPHPSHRAEALREFRWTIVEPVLFFALLARYVRTERDILRILTAFLVSCALNAQVGVDQYLSGNTWSMEGVGRAIGLYTGATAFGIFVGRGLAIAAALAIFLPPANETLRRHRWAYMLLCVPLALGMVFSFTRGAWIGVFVAIVGIAALARARRVLIPTLGVAVAGFAALLIIFRGAERFSLTGSSNLSRFAIWRPAWAIIKDHPLTGIGLDQFLYQDPAYGIPNTRFQTVNHPHNLLLDAWLRLGVWGLALVLALLAVYFLSGLRAYRGRRGTVVGGLVLALLAGMIDYVVHGMVDQAYFTQDLALSFWMMLGLLGAILRMGPAGAPPGTTAIPAVAAAPM